jgi:hypothetical protein
MSDQCQFCVVRGDFKKCQETPCHHHENWYEIELNKRLNRALTRLDNLKDLIHRWEERSKRCE